MDPHTVSLMFCSRMAKLYARNGTIRVKSHSEVARTGRAPNTRAKIRRMSSMVSLGPVPHLFTCGTGHELAMEKNLADFVCSAALEVDQFLVINRAPSGSFFL